ncbi:hypothetical protein KSF_028880 [Reticulibacter mediterranei]|uniref:DUF4175 domain-containing protein n=1 Tax=Reticulibacter mediterranei TaxID=2778369 RepID=A0A8J3II41_9CHLR|nr:hypothetical protein [Reticulibacter mediterranei]GHO92840.1 hypothetical protein KSF_028880 [Reticulibacter mediterranei]
MDTLTIFGASAVTIMLIAYAFEQRSVWWILIFAIACAASSLYGWLAGTWPFGIVEGIWALVALRRWWQQRALAIRSSSTREVRQ